MIMPLLRWDPQETERLRDEMSRMWSRVREDWNLDDTRPKTHVHQVENGFVVEFELPGVDPELVSLEVDQDSISVKGQFPASPMERDIRAGEQFHAVVNLPSDIDPDSAKAEYRHGLLDIHVNRASGRRRQISITSH